MSYKEMLQSFLNINPTPEIYIMIPPPVERDNFFISKLTVNQNFVRVINEIAKDMNIDKAHVIDIFNAMGGSSFSKKDLFCDKTCCDGVHPVDAGYKVLAQTVYNALFVKQN